MREKIAGGVAVIRIGGMAQHRRYRLQADVAQWITTTRIKVEDAGLRHQQHEDWLEAFNRKIG